MHIGLQTSTQLVLEALEDRRCWRRRGRAGGRLFQRRRLQHLTNSRLQLTDAELARDRFVGERNRPTLVLERDERPRVTGAELTLLYRFEYDCRQLEDSQKRGDRRAILPDRIGDLCVREPKLVREAPISTRLLDGVQVRSLKILDKRQRQQRSIVDIANDCRDVFPAKPGRRTEAPLTGDELVPIPGRADRDRLEKPRRLERRLQLGELRFVELAARLVRVGPNCIER